MIHNSYARLQCLSTSGRRPTFSCGQELERSKWSSCDELVSIVPFGAASSLQRVLDEVLSKDWDRSAILDYTRTHHWDKRVSHVCHALDGFIDGSSRFEQRVLDEKHHIRSK